MALGTMQALSIRAYDGIPAVTLGEWPKPAPGAMDILVEVRACGVNPLDWKVCDGSVAAFLDRSPPFVIGADVAGVVAAVGSGVTRFAVGDAVFGQAGLLHGFAEYCAAAEHRFARKSDALSFAEAACLPVSGTTAMDALFDKGSLQAGERVLIHGGAGGVGHLAIQLAREAGAHVTATTSAGNADFVRALGADDVIDYRAGPFEDVVHDMDLVVDTLAGDVLRRSWSVLKPDGRVVTTVPPEAGTPQGPRTALFALGKPDEDGGNLKRLADLAASGRLKVHIQQIFDFADAKAALELSRAGHVRGKLALTPSPR